MSRTVIQEKTPTEPRKLLQPRVKQQECAITSRQLSFNTRALSKSPGQLRGRLSPLPAISVLSVGEGKDTCRHTQLRQRKSTR